MLITKSLSKIKTTATFTTDNLHHEKNIHTKRNGKKKKLTHTKTEVTEVLQHTWY